jgi:pimeloyl-ACP methyl ester carboxylesterase
MKRFALLLLFATSSLAQTPDAVFKDPPQQTDRKLAARMVELHVPVLDDGKPTSEVMNGIMYLAAGAGTHPTVILLHGFPGNEQNLDLAQSMRRSGWNVLYFHYRGSWGSGGDFSFAHAMDDTQTAIRFVHEPSNVKKYNIDRAHVVLVGHSMGGFMAEYTAAHDFGDFNDTKLVHGTMPDGFYHVDVIKHLNIQGIVLISPWDLGRAGTFLTDKPENQKYVSSATDEFRGYEPALHGFTAEKGIAELRSHAADWELANMATRIVGKKIPILMVTGKYEDAREEGFNLLRDAFRKAAKDSGAKAFASVELPTDHAYSDQRIALQSAILNWLGKIKK